MPSSSRKKNKGRDRKAKKEESKKVELYNYWRNWASGEYSSGTNIVQCNHGLQLPDISHPVSISSFLNTFFNYAVDSNLIDVIQQNPAVWNNASYRIMAAAILTSIGANWMLHPNGERKVGNLAKTILLLESYGKTNEFYSTVYRHDIATKKRDLSIENVCIDMAKRDMLKFFRKRMACKCLKKMHLEARKTMPKMGQCEYCGAVKYRSLLMVCSRCMVDQYCSRNCQVADAHRGVCDDYVEAEEQIANATINT